MIPQSIVLSTTHVSTIQREAEAASPAECCGLLIGTGAGRIAVLRTQPAPNLSGEPDRFLIDPQVQFDCLRRLRGGPDRIVGHYHSHPNGRATPSGHDLAMAAEDEAVWLIIPVENGRAGDPQAFVRGPGADRFTAVPLTVRS